MKKLLPILPIILTVLFLTVLVLPIDIFAADSFTIKNISGDIYPSSDELVLELRFAEGTKVVGFQFSALSFDENKLEFDEVTTTIKTGDLIVSDGKYILVDNNLNVLECENNALCRINFKLKPGAEVGDTLTVTLKQLKISAKDGSPLYNSDLSFSITVKERPKSTNCNLSGLSVEEGSLSPKFNADSANSDYALTVPHNVNALTLNVKTASSRASYEITGNENFLFGTNEVKITVTAESGAERVYTLTVTKLDPPSEDASLSGITVPEGTITPEFSADVKNYTVSVAADVLSLGLTVSAGDEKATVEVIGNSDFAVGENTVEIVVTAENGNTDKYIITVTRARPIETSALLSSLSFGNYLFDLEFSSDQKEYAITVPYEDDLTGLLNYTTDSSYATVDVTLPSEYLVGANTVLVKVTAEDGVTVETYTVTVNREARILYSDSSLAGLTASVEGLSPVFSPDILVYTLVTAPKCSSITFYPVANTFFATAEETTTALIPGLNTVLLTCTAENGEKTIYTVHVFVPVVEQKRELILYGTPQVGEKLTLKLVGESDGGSYKWYVGGELVEGVTADSYLLLSSSANQTVYAEYHDVDGTVLTSHTLTVTAASEGATQKADFSTADILIVAIAVLFAFGAGGCLGALFFGKKSGRMG